MAGGIENFFCFFLGTSLKSDKPYIDVHVRALHGPQVRITGYDAPGRNVEWEEGCKRAEPFFGPRTLVFCVIPSGFDPKWWKKFEPVVKAARAKKSHVVLILQDAKDMPKATRRRMKAFVVDGNVSWKKQEVSRYVDELRGSSESACDEDEDED